MVEYLNVTLLQSHLHGFDSLRTRIIKFSCLSDTQTTRSEDQHFGDLKGSSRGSLERQRLVSASISTDYIHTNPKICFQDKEGGCSNDTNCMFAVHVQRGR